MQLLWSTLLEPHSLGILKGGSVRARSSLNALMGSHGSAPTDVLMSFELVWGLPALASPTVIASIAVLRKDQITCIVA